MAQNAAPRAIHVFVALADNQVPGAVPVPARLGNGEDAGHNLYWGSAYGVKTFFARGQEWILTRCLPDPKPGILERCVFRHRAADVYLVADAFRGTEIRAAILGFLDASAGGGAERITVESASGPISISASGGSSLVA